MQGVSTINILQKIIAEKRDDVKYRKTAALCADLRARITDMPATRGFNNAIKQHAKPIALIAEIKKASPSKGLISEDFNPEWISRKYEEGGAACISVLTDEYYFMGSPGDLQTVRKTVSLPILRKDFTVDELCVLEARVMGADAVLLIAAGLSPLQLQDYTGIAHEVGLDALIEVHAASEMGAALNSGSDLIGINNRDLATFDTDLATTESLAPLASGRTVISESAIASRGDVERVAAAGASGILVGETLMRSRDPAAAIRGLLGT